MICGSPSQAADGEQSLEAAQAGGRAETFACAAGTANTGAQEDIVHGEDEGQDDGVAED